MIIKNTRLVSVFFAFLFNCGAVFAGTPNLPQPNFSSGSLLTADDLQGNFQELANQIQDNDTRISAISQGATPSLHCNKEFDLIESAANQVNYWPNTSNKAAEILQFGWLCFNHADNSLDQTITPTTLGVAHSNGINSCKQR